MYDEKDVDNARNTMTTFPNEEMRKCSVSIDRKQRKVRLSEPCDKCQRVVHETGEGGCVVSTVQ